MDDKGPKPKREMSRGTQTKWIVVAILLVGGVFYDHSLRSNPNDIDAPCRHILGDDGACLAHRAAMRISGQPY